MLTTALFAVSVAVNGGPARAQETQPAQRAHPFRVRLGAGTFPGCVFSDPVTLWLGCAYVATVELAYAPSGSPLEFRAGVGRATYTNGDEYGDTYDFYVTTGYEGFAGVGYRLTKRPWLTLLASMGYALGSTHFRRTVYRFESDGYVAEKRRAKNNYPFAVLGLEVAKSFWDRVFLSARLSETVVIFEPQDAAMDRRLGAQLTIPQLEAFAGVAF